LELICQEQEMLSEKQAIYKLAKRCFENGRYVYVAKRLLAALIGTNMRLTFYDEKLVYGTISVFITVDANMTSVICSLL
jgi:hypothetical protein